MKAGLTLSVLALLAASAQPEAAEDRTNVASGFATIETAPPSPFPASLPPPENRPRDEAGYYAQLAGVSDAVARRRLAEQEQARPEFERLLGILREKEAGNFTDARMVHRPDWAFIFYFKRDPEQTLGLYTRNPHFRSAQARYGREELDSIAAPWIARLAERRLLGGHGTDATLGEIVVQLLVSEAEYRAVADREGWDLPDAIRLEYSQPVMGDSVAAKARAMIRIFPQSDRALGATNQALLRGRIVLRDGCSYVTGGEQPDRLAYFAREVALGFDDEGRLSLSSRGPEPRHLGRIGEEFSWGGPIGAPETMPMVAELRASCGSAPLEHVGIPQSARLFRVRPWVVDAIAERRRITREEAWRLFRACLEEKEEGGSGAPFDCDMI